MSEYKDFVKDYPARCIDVLDKFYAEAKNADREVTLLLMATAGSLVMPYERLSFGTSIKQPDLDRVARKQQIEQLNKELVKPIKDPSILGTIIRKWRYSEIGEIHDEESIIKAAKNARKISFEKNVATAIKIIRHSIAHGNVLAIASPYEGQINDLVFVSRSGKRGVVSAEFVVLTPADLECFLRKWCGFLCSLPTIKQQEILGILESVAS